MLANSSTTLFWFRRDLRLDDNAAFHYALKENENVLPLFIFDRQILDQLPDKADQRVEFIYSALKTLQFKLEKLGSTLMVLDGKPKDLFQSLEAKAVYTNHDYEPYARKRDEEVEVVLKNKKIPFKSYKDHVIFEKNEVTKDDGSPYTIFTPYSRKWKSKLNTSFAKSYPTKKYLFHLIQMKPLPFPTLGALGFTHTGKYFPKSAVPTRIIEKYNLQRNFPAIRGTSRLSVHLRFGTISIRKLMQVALKGNEAWLNELIWREFYQMILWHFPHVVSRSFKSAYDRIVWRNNENEFNLWCLGKTGYPMVDAGMRELNATGFMHNRVRMVTASFLVKHLLIDWRWGEAYFAKMLLDFDLAANNGGWQWAAGSGCDAAPYFRVFNPNLQMKKFDPALKYIKKWVPELGSSDYNKPIVEHSVARERVLKVYKAALNNPDIQTK